MSQVPQPTPTPTPAPGQTYGGAAYNPGTEGVAGYPYATFGTRFLARRLDGILYGAIAGIDLLVGMLMSFGQFEAPT